MIGTISERELERITRDVVALSKNIGSWMLEQTEVHETSAEIKSENNLVTYVDKESERRFVDGLSILIPEAGFVAEEGSGEKKEGLNWVIDPLDGTTNFVHSVPIWCTSIGLCYNSEPILGVIYAPGVQDECFYAWKGGGAYCNDKKISVSSILNLQQSLLATGFPYDDFGRESQYLKLFQELLHGTRGLRRLGSAALDMAWTACGRLESFYEYGLNPWDVAAGTIIIREAGGLVTEFSGGPDPVFGNDLVCSNGFVHQQMLDVIAKYFK